MDDEEYYKMLLNTSENKIGCGTPVIATIIVFVLFMLSSCATKTKVEYIEKEVVKYETKIQHDTLINNVHDSIRIETKGDTVFVDRWHTSVKEKIVNRTDTCWRDSVRTEIKENTVEKLKTPKWCYFCLGLCIIFIIFALIKLLRWLRLI
jgi:hypothetical protein